MSNTKYLIEQVKRSAAQGNFKAAIKSLRKLNILDEYLVLKLESRINNFQKDGIKGVKDERSATVERNQISDSIFQLIKLVESQIEEEASIEEKKSEYAEGISLPYTDQNEKMKKMKKLFTFKGNQPISLFLSDLEIELFELDSDVSTFDDDLDHFLSNAEILADRLLLLVDFFQTNKFTIVSNNFVEIIKETREMWRSYLKPTTRYDSFIVKIEYALEEVAKELKTIKLSLNTAN